MLSSKKRKIGFSPNATWNLLAAAGDIYFDEVKNHTKKRDIEKISLFQKIKKVQKDYISKKIDQDNNFKVSYFLKLFYTLIFNWDEPLLLSGCIFLIFLFYFSSVKIISYVFMIKDYLSYLMKILSHGFPNILYYHCINLRQILDLRIKSKWYYHYIDKPKWKMSVWQVSYIFKMLYFNDM